jgi:hypothetical protein
VTIALFGLVTFVVLFGGALLGLFLGRILPEKYRSDSTQKIVQTATGMVSLLAALVLGLLVATAKNKFDTNNRQTEQFAGSLMLLNRELSNYGPEASDAKALLRKYMLQELRPSGPAKAGSSRDPTIRRPGSCLRACSRV